MRRHIRLLWTASAILAVSTLVLILSTGLRSPGGQATAAGNAPATRELDEQAPVLVGHTLTGDAFDLTSLRGNVILVNVWASWCEPCRGELPLLADAARRWAGQGLRVVGINIRDDAGSARSLMAQTGTTTMTVVSDPTGSLSIGWGVSGVPETFLVDRGGRVRVWAQGALTASWLEQRVPPLLAS